MTRATSADLTGLHSSSPSGDSLRSDLVLGIESSCDETAASVIRGPAEILSSVVASQIPIHRRFGGVVPELASRQHLLCIDSVITEAMETAGCRFEELGGVAVTYGPGLIGSLLVGLQVAKSIAFAHNLPLAAVNHLEGHIRSLSLEHEKIPKPALFLVVSGGHTSLYLVRREGLKYELMARTRDDAAGEAYDKAAKFLGLGYPGGPIVDRLAKHGNSKAFHFGRPRMSDGSLDFSFSGMKTALLRHVEKEKMQPLEYLDGDGEEPQAKDCPQEMLDLLASFQEGIVRTLADRTFKVAERSRAAVIGLVGGVACNSRLRQLMAAEGKKRGIPVLVTRPGLTTDNAAMIAQAGYEHLKRGKFADSTLNADPGAVL
jgi:N6-L-threonylcarbamoyladenine synthase